MQSTRCCNESLQIALPYLGNSIHQNARRQNKKTCASSKRILVMKFLSNQIERIYSCLTLDTTFFSNYCPYSYIPLAQYVFFSKLEDRKLVYIGVK